jgi:hypothetical protein
VHTGQQVIDLATGIQRRRDFAAHITGFAAGAVVAGSLSLAGVRGGGLSFTPVSGGRSRLDDLPVSVAACLASHAMNIGYRPVVKKGVPALERARLSHVFQNYVRPETLAAANAPLIARQAGLLLARAWGGGLAAAVDGMRFVVPVLAAMQFAARSRPAQCQLRQLPAPG